MPSNEEIEAAIKRINQGIADHACVVTMYDAVTLLQAYREELYLNIGVVGMEEPDGE